MYRPVTLHVSLAGTLLYSVALLNVIVAEEEGEPQGPHFSEMCCGFDDQLGGPVGCLVGKGTLIGFCLLPSYGTFASAVHLVICMSFGRSASLLYQLQYVCL